MAHADRRRDFGRNKSWRKATVRSLAQALLKRERIQTTRAKAKEAQILTERLITLGKEGSLHARRRAVSILNDVDLVGRLFSEIAPRFKNRQGGYTRVLHNGTRAGDGAAMAWIELVELGIPLTPKPKAKGKEEKAQKPAVKELPAPKKEKKEEVRTEEPEAEKKKPAKPKQEFPKPEDKKKPTGFVDGLRKLFKRRDNP